MYYKETHQKVIAVHLLNDFSGSPRVLATVAGCWLADGKTVEIWTSNPQQSG